MVVKVGLRSNKFHAAPLWHLSDDVDDADAVVGGGIFRLELPFVTSLTLRICCATAAIICNTIKMHPAEALLYKAQHAFIILYRISINVRRKRHFIECLFVALC